jgi:hypothetical protein
MRHVGRLRIEDRLLGAMEAWIARTVSVKLLRPILAFSLSLTFHIDSELLLAV